MKKDPINKISGIRKNSTLYRTLSDLGINSIEKLADVSVVSTARKCSISPETLWGFRSAARHVIMSSESIYSCLSDNFPPGHEAWEKTVGQVLEMPDAATARRWKVLEDVVRRLKKSAGILAVFLDDSYLMKIRLGGMGQ